ncbi:MAG: apolipoprotein N-acyltransferase [Amaricoccus sp.]|uniref:apolipoprotein N-acyltransferase n=1 Tax=Amaricoccus sp. TaxID=1872485 RepID=UPI0039E48074
MGAAGVWLSLLLALGAGAALALGQPPLSWPLAVLAALPVLFRLFDAAQGTGRAFLLGWAAGVGYFGAGMFWIVDPFLVQPEIFGWLAPFALVGMATGLALFWGVPFAVARAIVPRGRRSGVAGALLLAALWFFAEYARGHVLTGFPWALQAYAWIGTPVAQTLALGGPYLLTLATLAAGLVLGAGSWRAAVAVGLLVAAGWGWGSWRLDQPVPPRAPALSVRLVQPNAAQADKWRPEKEREFFARHLTLTAGAPRADVTIWSETAVPFALGDRPDLQAESAAAAAPGQLILGIVRGEPAADGTARWFNSLAVLGPDGAPLAIYDKHHLVPFGEYIPFPRAIAALGIPALQPLTQGGFTPGPGPHLVQVPGLPPFLPLICYEAIFPGSLRAPEGRAEWLVQVTNDAWFGEASGPWQHLAQARARAIEQGLPLARAANTGVSAMIDPYGRIVAKSRIRRVGCCRYNAAGCPTTNGLCNLRR